MMLEMIILRQILAAERGAKRQVRSITVRNNACNEKRGIVPKGRAFVNKLVLSIRKIRSVIAHLLPAGHPTLVMVADELNVSPRTLQRRLADNKLSHSQLVNQARLSKACQLLTKQEMNIRDIARETGFATPSGFSRAFQSWTGSSPRSFRQDLG